MGRLEDKVAIVTGAARGTGEATARRFVEEGAKVVVADVNDELGEKTAAELGAHYVHLDVSSESDWAAGVEDTVGRFGCVDVLINNAGLLHLAAIEDTTPEIMERLWRVNTLGPFLGIRAVAEPMKAAGSGSIVNVVSVDGISAKNGVSAYASSKWGVRGMAKVAALELGKHGIRVNTVCPGSGSFEMVQPFVEKAIQRHKEAAARGEPTPDLGASVSHNVLNRRTTMEDIAAMILFLASDEAAACTGGDYAVDAGYTAGKIIPGAPGA
jgi:3alpha(or 20beta)-hydroxysteroid dehydrogenase